MTLEELKNKIEELIKLGVSDEEGIAEIKSLLETPKEEPKGFPGIKDEEFNLPEDEEQSN